MTRPTFALSITVLAVALGCDRAPAATNPRSGDPPPATEEAGPPAAMSAAVAAQHAAAAAGPAEVGPIRLARAPSPDGRTIAEVFAGHAGLEGRSVAVRGKVVKFSPGIMGRNWLHLRDGTGSPERKDHDLTVTTDGTAAVGDVVLVRGIVRTDRDFGAGYTYPVIVEEAKLSK